MASRPRNQVALSAHWRTPQFNNVVGMFERIDNTRRATIEPRVHRGEVVPDRYTVIDAQNGEYFADVSEKYIIVQNSELLTPLALAIQESGLPVRGSIIEGYGMMEADILIGSPLYVPNTLDESPFMLRITLANSYNKIWRAFAMMNLVRLKCLNGMTGIAGLCGEMSHKHLEGVTEQVAEWLAMFNTSHGIVDNLPGVIERAQSQVMMADEFQAMLRAVGVGKRDAINIVDNIDQLNPDAVDHALTIWNGYNAANAYFSHRTKGSRELNEESLGKVGSILTENYARLVDEGLKIIAREAAPASP